MLVELLNDYLGISQAAAAHLLQLESRKQNTQDTPSGHDISTYFAKVVYQFFNYRFFCYLSIFFLIIDFF